MSLNYGRGVEAYHTIQDFKAEVRVLEELLLQRRWRRGKRGLWYERCALVLMFHLVKKDSPEDEKKAGDGEEVNVEIFALQQYEAEGFRGFHSEGRIVTTIPGLPSWDIIFSTVPGAFGAPFQSAPLDIGEGFYHAREDAIEKRLEEVADGQAAEILAAVDDQWDMFEKNDLMEIVQCMPAKGLSVICRLLCEDYSARASGVPGLLVWKYSTTEFKFVEVKCPEDSLQENQKVWIDVFLRHDVPVELCSIVEKGQKPEETQGRKRAAKRGKAPKRASRKSSPHRVIEIHSDDEADRYTESESE
ncbi:hypothetical protein BD410DRAFT_826694 [Rickenella mellea]|uniref:Fanconi-associated nuclease n=1 Tax=Rickenella mellea TaxID=50990 RepID=A0A4Y7QCW6_9AGAM|nr:hypothetical protein BD410DRAFT_826694 [Rickenella mellea]